jgi:hypothetical protein
LFLSPPKDDPDYVKYFKMIKMGVPIPVVKMKMDSEGFDSSYLEYDNPFQLLLLFSNYTLSTLIHWAPAIYDRSLSPDQMATAGQGPSAGGGGAGVPPSAAAAASDSDEDPESDID